MVDLRVLSGDEVTDEPLGWPVRSHTLLGGGLVSDFVRDEVETPAGEVMRRDYLLHPGAVGIIALDDADAKLWRGEAVEILDPSPHRIEPRCAAAAASCSSRSWR